MPKLLGAPALFGQLEEVLSQHIIPRDPEGMQVGWVDTLDAEVRVKNKKRLGQGVDDPLGLHMAAPQQAVEVF